MNDNHWDNTKTSVLNLDAIKKTKNIKPVMNVRPVIIVPEHLLEKAMEIYDKVLEKNKYE